MAANAGNTSICLTPETFVYSEGKKTIGSFIRQKTRHLSSSHRYRWQDKALLGLSSMVHILMYISAVGLILLGGTSIYGFLLGYWLFMMIIQYPICKKLHSMDLWLWYSIYDIMMCIYYIAMIPFTFIKKHITWS